MADTGSRSHLRAWFAAVVVCAAAVVAIGVLYAQHPRQLPIRGPQPLSVLVAARDIPAGTSALAAEQDGAFSTVEMQQNQIPVGALSESIALHGTVARVPIKAGETIVAGQWGRSR